MATNTPGTLIHVGQSPFGVAVTPNGTTAYVTNGGDNTVTPIDLATNTPGTPIPVGIGPSGIAVTPAPGASTSTQLTVNPATPASSATTETLTATVTPTAAGGSVQFQDCTAPLGNPVTVADGSASMTTTLASGTHSLTAVFTPTNATAFTGSMSPTVSYLVNPAPVVPGGNGPIVFDSNRDGKSQIYVMNADGSNQTRLTGPTASNYYPAFSPDGTRIAFTSDRDGNSQIYVMNADGSNQTRLRRVTTGYAVEPAFSPDGTRIAFSGIRGIYVMNADGSNETLLTPNLSGAYDPAFSPDGTRIAFVGGEIFVMSADGSNQTQLTTVSALNSDPHWGIARASTTTLAVTPPSPAGAGSTETLTATITPTTAGAVCSSKTGPPPWALR